MGRKRAPMALKRTKGDTDNRFRTKNEAPVTPGIPEPPKELDTDGLAEWSRLAPMLYRAGLLALEDRGALTMCCQAFSRWQRAQRLLAKAAEADPIKEGLVLATSNGNFVQNPLVGVANKAAAEYMRFATEFGMTPSSRSRIDVNPSGGGGTAKRLSTNGDDDFYD